MDSSAGASSTGSDVTALQMLSDVSHVVDVDIQGLCRICGNINDFLVPIFEDQGKENDLGPKINQHLPIQVSFIYFLLNNSRK